MPKTHWSLTEHRKTIQGRVLDLGTGLRVISCAPTNEDELANQLRRIDTKVLFEDIKKAEELSDELVENGQVEKARKQAKELHELNQKAYDILLDMIATMVLDEDGGKVAVEQLRSAIANPEEANAVMEAVVDARSVDPPRSKSNGTTRN